MVWGEADEFVYFYQFIDTSHESMLRNLFISKKLIFFKIRESPHLLLVCWKKFVEDGGLGIKGILGLFG